MQLVSVERPSRQAVGRQLFLLYQMETIYGRLGSLCSNVNDNNHAHFYGEGGLMESVDIYCEDGIKVSSIYINGGEQVAGLSLKLSTNIIDHTPQITDISGLIVDSQGLGLAIATGIRKSISTTIIDGLITVGTDIAEKGGLAINETALTNHLSKSYQFNKYINSLITQRLTIK